MDFSVSQEMWIKPFFARWVHPIKCIPGDRCRAAREWNCDYFPFISLYENKQTAFENLLSWGEYKLTQQSTSLHQLAGENGEAYSPKQCSSNTDRKIMFYKLGKLAKWNIHSACLSTEALSTYEFPYSGCCSDELRMSLGGSSLSNKKGSLSLSNFYNNYFRRV